MAEISKFYSRPIDKKEIAPIEAEILYLYQPAGWERRIDEEEKGIDSSIASQFHLQRERGVYRLFRRKS